MIEVYFGLGANLGDREENLYKALAELVKLGPLERSEWYETEPVDIQAAPLFLNGVVRLWTEIPAQELHKCIEAIEKKIGRDKILERTAESKQPRVIDIDMLFYGQEVINLPDLIVPHPRLQERAFVLVPLSELTLDFSHPVSGLTVREMLSRVNLTGVKKWR